MSQNRQQRRNAERAAKASPKATKTTAKNKAKSAKNNARNSARKPQNKLRIRIMGIIAVILLIAVIGAGIYSFFKGNYFVTGMSALLVAAAVAMSVTNLRSMRK